MGTPATVVAPGAMTVADWTSNGTNSSPAAAMPTSVPASMV
jgi:hypothetical protein